MPLYLHSWVVAFGGFNGNYKNLMFTSLCCGGGWNLSNLGEREPEDSDVTEFFLFQANADTD